MATRRVPVFSFSRARQGVGGRCGVAQCRTHDDARSSVHRTAALRPGFGPRRVGEPVFVTNAAQDQNSE